MLPCLSKIYHIDTTYIHVASIRTTTNVAYEINMHKHIPIKIYVKKLSIHIYIRIPASMHASIQQTIYDGCAYIVNVHSSCTYTYIACLELDNIHQLDIGVPAHMCYYITTFIISNIYIS